MVPSSDMGFFIAVCRRCNCCFFMLAAIPFEKDIFDEIKICSCVEERLWLVEILSVGTKFNRDFVRWLRNECYSTRCYKKNTFFSKDTWLERDLCGTFLQLWWQLLIFWKSNVSRLAVSEGSSSPIWWGLLCEGSNCCSSLISFSDWAGRSDGTASSSVEGVCCIVDYLWSHFLLRRVGEM